MVEFRNTAGVEISKGLQARLTDSLNRMKAKLDLDGHTVETYRTNVAILFLTDDGGDESILVVKDDLRKFIKILHEDEHAPRIQDSLIDRCMQELPSGQLRVLFISTELCGTIQVHPDATSMQVTGLETNRPLSLRHSSDLYPSKQTETVEEVTQNLVKLLKPYPKKFARKILQQIHDEDKELARMRKALLDSEHAQEKDLEEFDALVPDFRRKFVEVEKRALKVPVPPSVNTAANVEALLMAMAYTFAPLNYFSQFRESSKQKELSQVVFELVGLFAHKSPAVTRVLNRANGALLGRPYSTHLQEFGIEWLNSGFPKLEVGHKLAASLAMTDVPHDIEVLAPWKAWSLVVPPGLFGESEGKGLTRVLVEATTIRFIIGANGEIFGPFTEGTEFKKMTERMRASGSEDTAALATAIDSLVRGSCLALSNPDDYKKQSLKEKAPSKKKDPREPGLPDFSVARFMLSAPVEIDLRQHLLDTLSGKKKGHGGGAPTVQFFVRGHWRNQAHGKGMLLRKQMRIEGYWKGPEHGAVKLGNYKVKDEEDGQQVR